MYKKLFIFLRMEENMKKLNNYDWYCDECNDLLND